MKGQKPVPRLLKIARGNPSQHKIRDDEPTPAAADLTVPALLEGDVDARGAWLELAPMLARIGVFTEADRHVLTIYCSTFARWVRAERELQVSGVIIYSRRNKYPIPSPHLGIAKSALEHCARLMTELGLTPVARARLHVAKPEADDAKRDRFFKGARA